LEPIWIFQPDALGSEKGRFWFADRYTVAVKKFTHRIYVGTLEEQLRVGMSPDSSGVRHWRPFIFIIGSIQHQFGSSESEPHPVNLAISGAPVFDNFKAKRTIERD